MKLVFLGTIGRSFFLRSLSNRNIVEKKDYVFLDEKKELDTIKNADFSIPKKNFIVSWNPDDSKININENASDKLLKALGKSQSSLEELKERKLEVRTVDNENIYTNVDNTITIKEAFSCVDNLIISEIKNFLNITK